MATVLFLGTIKTTPAKKTDNGVKHRHAYIEGGKSRVWFSVNDNGEMYAHRVDAMGTSKKRSPDRAAENRDMIFDWIAKQTKTTVDEVRELLTPFFK